MNDTDQIKAFERGRRDREIAARGFPPSVNPYAQGWPFEVRMAWLAGFNAP